MADIRLLEAKTLLKEGFYDGSRYLAGYVIEFALKARICRILDLIEYPESGDLSKTFKTHKYDVLLKLAGLERKFDNAKNLNHRLFVNWSRVTDWKEEFRYKPVGSSSISMAKDMIKALEDTNDGVYIWIKQNY